MEEKVAQKPIKDWNQYQKKLKKRAQKLLPDKGYCRVVVYKKDIISNHPRNTLKYPFNDFKKEIISY